MKKKVIQILSIALCMVLLSGSTVTANAAIIEYRCISGSI